MRKFLRSKNGQSLTEFALILPVLIILIFGGIDMLTTSNTQAKVEDFYKDLAYSLVKECPSTDEIWKFQNSGTDWEKNPGSIPYWENSTVATIADYHSLNQKNFAWISNNALSADHDNSKDFTNPAGQSDAQQFRIEKQMDSNSRFYYRVAFQYRQTTLSSYVFNFMFETKFNKTIQCSK